MGASHIQLTRPSLVVQGATLVCLAAIAATLSIALSQPWLGLTLASDPDAGTVRIVATDPSGPARAIAAPATLRTVAPPDDSGQAVAVEAGDIIEEPDVLDTYPQIDRLMERQSALAALLGRPQVALQIGTTGSGETVIVRPARTPAGGLPAAFWVQLLTGAASLLIGAWVWAMRPADIATRLFAFSGAMITLAAYPAAIYSSRELAIDGGLFRLLSALNHAGTIGFGIGMITMFLCYPRRLVPAWALWIVPAILVPWLAADLLRLAPNPPIGMQVPVVIAMLAIVGIVGVQWQVNRGDPRARAALGWLGLSVIVGAGAFVALIIGPTLLASAPAMQQGYAFGFFLLIYAGLALGVSRYRLFDLSEWAFRILFYTGGTLLLIAIDAALITFLHLQHAVSFGIALIAIGFAYLPLRGALWNRFVVRKGLEEHELFRAVIDVSFAGSPAERSERWRDLLQTLFDPLAIETADSPTARVGVRDEGLAMSLPRAADTPALVLRYPWRGRRLFGTAHKNLARELVRLMRYTEESRNAYERGSIEERRRIARDLHDDVGARLLSGLYKNDISDTHRVLRDAIADIRTIVSGLSTEQPLLGQMIAALRHESGERLAAAGIEMRWPLGDDDDSALALDYRVYRCFTSAHREIVSNAIRHAGARTVDIGVQRTEDRLIATMMDDGIGIDPAHTAGSPHGNGLRGLIRRLTELDGTLSIRRGARGTIVEVHIPLKAAPGTGPESEPNDTVPTFEGY
jgi:signal transduction histidine kinase